MVFLLNLILLFQDAIFSIFSHLDLCFLPGLYGKRVRPVAPFGSLSSRPFHDPALIHRSLPDELINEVRFNTLYAFGSWNSYFLILDYQTPLIVDSITWSLLIIISNGYIWRFNNSVVLYELVVFAITLINVPSLIKACYGGSCSCY